eukprot:gnl/MRDRNA2_/MRDRNA2_34487_c0_seq1.p1 gnl/MRDRNA2_/MRDRNA2_34487_c0~~gnl/MRDRNA2_/MRDRNA2_34487_c0_seq1.p1  ORF type:complete len:507 (+),score=108.35 gnl/MRDRNA2_/MRDRNA2_34487_c0_seq1:141-1661(+)
MASEDKPEFASHQLSQVKTKSGPKSVQWSAQQGERAETVTSKQSHGSQKTRPPSTKSDKDPESDVVEHAWSSVEKKASRVKSNKSVGRKSVFASLSGALKRGTVGIVNVGQAIKKRHTARKSDNESDPKFDPNASNSIVRPPTVRACGFELSKNGMVVLPLQVPFHVLERARDQAREALEQSPGKADGYYDVPLKERGRPDQTAFQEPSLLDLWEPVIEASQDRCAGRWTLLSSGFLACAPHAKHEQWPRAPPPVTAAEAVGAMLIGMKGSKGLQSGVTSLPCVHVMVPLIHVTPNRNGVGPAKLGLQEGDILICESNVQHQGFGVCSSGPQPMLYWTYLLRPLGQKEKDEQKRLDAQQDQNFSGWARKKGLRLPQVAISLIKRQDLRKSVWDEHSPQDGRLMRYEASVADVEDEMGAQETPGCISGNQEMPLFVAALEDEIPQPSAVQSKKSTDAAARKASFDNINSMFKEISATIKSDRHDVKQFKGKEPALSSIYTENAKASS